MTKPRRKYAGTKPTYQNSPDMMISCEEEKCLTTWKSICNDNLELKSNFLDQYDKIKKIPNFKYWLADPQDFAHLGNDLAVCSSQEEREKKFVELMSSLTSFSDRHEKQIYIRFIPPSLYGSMDEMRMFPDEVLEVIPILLKQQGTPIKANDERLARYHQEWKNPAPHLYKTMENSDFLRILEEFDVDKTKINVIQDPGHEICRLRHLKNGMDQIKLFAPDLQMVMDSAQAVSMVFQGLVCGVNWKIDRCDVHENCLVGLKPKFIALMKEYMAIEKGTYISLPHVITAILQHKKECPKTYLAPTPPPNYMLKQHDPDQDCPMHPYKLVAGHFALPVYSNFMPRPKLENHIPVWIVRVFMKFGWIQQFFERNEEKDLQELLMNSVLFLVPEKRTRMTEKFMMKVLENEATRA